MANNIDVKFSGQVRLRAAKYLYTGDVDNKDCLRALSTNFYTQAYSFNSSEITATSIANPSNAFDRDLTTTFASWSGLRKFLLNNYRFRPHTIIIDITNNSSATSLVEVNLSGYNEDNSFNVELSDNTSIINTYIQSPTKLIFNNLHKQYGNLRRGWCDAIQISANNNGVKLYQLYVYGEIIHKDQIKIPPTDSATTIETFTDSFISVDNLKEGSVVKEGSLILSPRRAHSVRRITMNGTYKISNNSEYNVWNFDPNGANRVVNLPRAPQFNHYLRINNIDGAHQIRVNDSDHSTLIQNLSITDGSNTLEAVWSGTQWIITS